MFDVNEFNSAIVKKGDNAEKAAKIMDMNPATLYRKMNGKSDFYRKEISKFCKYYNVNPNQIFFANEFTETQKATNQ